VETDLFTVVLLLIDVLWMQLFCGRHYWPLSADLQRRS